MYTNSNTAVAALETGWDLRGLHDDTKPTGADVPNGSTFLEMDTGSLYIWDKENSQWRAL